MRASKLIWGTFLILAAVFVLINQLGGFTTLGVGSIIVAILSLAFIVQCLAHLRIAPLPIPIAVLYIVFRAPLNLPGIQIWALLLTAVLASLGLAVLLPRRRRAGFRVGKIHIHKDSFKDRNSRMNTENCNGGNNPSVSVNFGSISRRICAGALETVNMECNFGALEIYFDQATLSPNGAEAVLCCNFGAIKILVPEEWQIIDNIDCSLGGVEVDKRLTAIKDGAPKLKITGSVSLGGVEVRRV
jgi:predicted membrane protein